MTEKRDVRCEGRPIPNPPAERIQDSPLLVALTIPQLDLLIHAAVALAYEEGDVIICEGEIGDALYLILKGSVSIHHPGKALMATLSGEETLHAQYEGDFFGEMAILDHEPRSATVFAAAPVVEVLRIGKDSIFRLFAEDTEFQVVLLMNLARVLSRRIRMSNQRRTLGN